MVASVLALSAGAYLRISFANWRWIVLAIAKIWVAETFNTAVEYLCDAVSPGYSIPVKHAKDIAAGAVLICAAAAPIIGAVAFIPYVELRLK